MALFNTTQQLHRFLGYVMRQKFNRKSPAEPLTPQLLLHLLHLPHTHLQSWILSHLLQCSSWTCCCVHGQILPPSWLLSCKPAGRQRCCLHPYFWQTTVCPIPGEAAALHGSMLESLWNLWGYRMYARKGVWWVSRVIGSGKAEIWQLLWQQCNLKSRGRTIRTKCKVGYIISYTQIMPVKKEIF